MGLSAEAGVLLIVVSPGADALFDSHDIVSCISKSTYPGTAVAANSAGQWSFVYITDRSPAQVADMLTQQYRSSNVLSEHEDQPGMEGYVAERRYCCRLDADRLVDCATYRKFDDATDKQKMTWEVFEEDFCVDKTV